MNASAVPRRRAPVATWAVVIGTAFLDRTVAAPSAIWTVTRKTRPEAVFFEPRPPRPPRRWTTQAPTQSRHGERPDPVGEMDRDRKGGERRNDAPERQREVGDREARLRVAHDRADQELEEDHRDRRGADPRDAARPGAAPRRASAARSRRRSSRPGRRTSARGTRARRRPRSGGGRGPSGRRGRPARRRRRAPIAQAPDPRPGLAPEEPHRQDDRQDPDGGRDHPVAVLVENAADHRRHEPAVGERPVRHRQARLGRGHEAPATISSRVAAAVTTAKRWSPGDLPPARAMPRSGMRRRRAPGRLVLRPVVVRTLGHAVLVGAAVDGRHLAGEILVRRRRRRLPLERVRAPRVRPRRAFRGASRGRSSGPG